MSQIFDTIAQFRQTFAKTHYWADMLATVENSPWHREANVAVHTDMVVDAFLARARVGTPDSNWSPLTTNDTFTTTEKAIATVFLALHFHDVGKPIAKEWCESAERGRYCRFGGHEQFSARMWEHYVTLHWGQMSVDFGLVPEDIFTIGWLIENHLPYDLKEGKLEAMVDTIITLFHDNAAFCNVDAFFEMVRADCWGRISDDHDTKKQKVLDWIGTTSLMVEDRLGNRQYDVKLEADAPTIYMLIGASGSGKSTFCDALAKTVEYEYYSWDALRLKMALEAGITTASMDPVKAYEKAWAYANDNGFGQYSQQAFSALVRARKNIVVDNTNTTRKSRRQFTSEVTKRGYKVVSVLFPIDLITLLDRQKSRTDKCVPMDAVRGQYGKISLPMLGGGDSHEVIVHAGNLKGGWNADKRFWKRVE